MLAQLTTAQIELSNLQAEGPNPISQVLSVPYHPEWFLEPTLQDLASSTAARYGIDPIAFQKVIACESNWDINIVGDFGTSFGLMQIHLPAHPDITQAEADDPIWAMNWAADQWSKGNAHIWTCARELGFG